MGRTWRDPRCPVCGERPKSRYGSGGNLLCACGKIFYREAGIKATEAEAPILAAKGFGLAQSADGDTYYWGPGDCLIWLYADGTFFGSHRVENHGTLEEYLEEASKPVRLKV